MSVIFSIDYETETLRFEISKGGVLKFIDYDLDYDLSLVEFGEPETNALYLLNSWKFNPITCIIFYFGLSKYEMVMLATDWAEHVLPIFRRYRKKDSRPRDAVRAARKCMELMGSPQGAVAITEASDAVSAVTEVSSRLAALTPTMRKTAWKAEAARSVARAAAWVAKAALDAAGAQSGFVIPEFYRTSVTNALQEVSSEACNAVESAKISTDLEASDGELVRVRQEEISWQVRRFVDVIEATRAGKPWPPLDISE